MSISPVIKSGLPIALTMGDPAGIGSEITVLAWKKRQQSGLPPFFILSRKSLFDQLAALKDLKIPLATIKTPHEACEVFSDALPILELPDAIEAMPGKPDPACGKMTILAISKSVEIVKNGFASSIVTNPINKHVLYEAGFAHPGHTEFLAKLAEQWGEGHIRPVMMLSSPQLRTVPLTIHIPLVDVAGKLTKSLIMETARIVSGDLTKYFGLKSPRLAVAGLNPHAGENGAMGTAENEMIEPAIRALKSEGINVTGPYPADTLFHAEARKAYDVVIGMYHDQALIPIKTLGFDEGVNATLGLPFVRTSPDHGTAYDIAGKGIAKPTSLIEAIKLAGQMAHQSTQCTHARGDGDD